MLKPAGREAERLHYTHYIHTPYTHAYKHIPHLLTHVQYKHTGICTYTYTRIDLPTHLHFTLTDMTGTPTHAHTPIATYPASADVSLG